MPLGPGKYDDVCTLARISTHAQAVLLIVIGGQHGNGFSAQGDPVVLACVPEMLERVAREMRADMKKG